MAKKVINSFNSGELSPYLYARSDFEKYQSGCLVMENFVPLPYGGATRRPAVEYTVDSKDNDQIRLISFVFSIDEAFILEFGDLYIRMYKDGVLKDEVVTTYLEADLKGLKFVESADVMWFVHPSYPVQRLSRNSDTDWTFAEEAFDYPPFLEQNTTATTIIPSATSGSVTLTSAPGIFVPGHVGTYFELAQLRGSEGAVITNTTALFTEVFSDELNVGKSNWNVATAGAGWTGRVTLQRSFDNVIWEDYVVLGDTSNLSPITQAENFTLASDAEEKIGTYIRLKILQDDYILEGQIIWTITAESIYWYSLYEITAYTSATEVTATTIHDPAGINATATWSEGAFSDYRGYPRAIALHENRLCYAGTATNPNTIWLSQTDDYSNFALGSVDNAGLKLTINSGRVDEIRWMLSQAALVIGTIGSEWTLAPVSDQLPITPTAFDLKRKTAYGTNDTQAILVNSAILFFMRQGRKLREWTFQWEAQDYIAPDLSILAEHITKGGVQDAAFQQQPDNIIWLVRTDGQLVGMTYERDQNVVGWHRHIMTGGLFESVAVIPREEEEDEVWVSCNVGGTRMIGKLNDREWGTNYVTEWQGSDLWVDYQASGDALHLAGKTVDIVIDGVIQAQEVVTGGGDISASLGTNNIVGLPFTSTLAPMYLDIDSQYGTTKGSKKDGHQAIIRFKDTFSAKVGQATDSIEDVEFRGDDSALYSGEGQAWFDNASEFLQTCYVVQEDPMPCTVLSMIPEVR